MNECYFLNLKKLKHSFNSRLTPLYKEVGGGGVFEIFLKRGVSDFSHKNGGVGKIDGIIFKKARVSLVFILTNPFQCHLGVCVCVCACLRVLFIYTISISIICVSREKSSLIASNQQMYDFYK